MKNLTRILLSGIGIFALTLTSCNFGNLDCLRGEGDIETRIIDFDEIEGFDLRSAIELTVTEGNDQEISIRAHGNVIDDLEIGSRVRNGILILDFDSDCVTLRDDIEIFATIKTLSSIETSGSSKIRTNGTFENVRNLQLESSGSTDIDLDLGDDMRFISMDISGSGDIQLSGETEDQEIEITGSGDVKNFDLISQTAKVEITGSGDVELFVEQTLDIEISGSGDICFRGAGAINSSDVSGSGRVRNCN